MTLTRHLPVTRAAGTAGEGQRGRCAAESCRGFTLLELLLALALGLIVIAGMTHLFLSSRQTHASLERQARLQESGRYALQLIGRSARGAGYLGCNARPERIVSTLNGELNTLFELDIGKRVSAFDADGGGSAATFAGAAGIDPGQVTPGTDMIAFRRLAGPAVRVAHPVSGDGAVVVQDGDSSGPGADDFVLIGDCRGSMLFRVSGVVRSAGYATLLRHTGSGPYENSVAKARSAAGRVYGPEGDAGAARVARVLTETYFVALGRGVDSAGEPVRSLWRRAGLGAAGELVEGIHDLKISFAVDTRPEDGVAEIHRHVGFGDLPPGGIIRAVQVQVSAGEPPNLRTFAQTFSLRNVG